MRVLLYGMQSSGASLVTYFLGQQKRSFAIVDLWSWELVPPLEIPRARHIFAKCTVTTMHMFEQHVHVFHPDRTVLILRDPAQNYASLRRKHYCDESGPIDDKFRKLEEVYQRRAEFDLTLTYEDFVSRRRSTVNALRSVGIDAEARHYSFPRSKDAILSYNVRHSDWAREHYNEKWGFGNVQGSYLKSETLNREVPLDVDSHVRQLCPSVYEFYRLRRPEPEAMNGRENRGFFSSAFEGTRAVINRMLP